MSEPTTRMHYPAIVRSGCKEVPYFQTNALYVDEAQARRDIGRAFVRLYRSVADGILPYPVLDDASPDGVRVARRLAHRQGGYQP